MLAWVVIYRRHLRQSPQSRFIRALPFPASPLNLRLFTLDFRSSLSPNSHGIISFAAPHPPTPLESYRFKNSAGRGYSRHSRGGTTRSDIPSFPYLVTSLPRYLI